MEVLVNIINTNETILLITKEIKYDTFKEQK